MKKMLAFGFSSSFFRTSVPAVPALLYSCWKTQLFDSRTCTFGRSQRFLEYRFQRIRPNLVSLEGRVQFVGVHHALEQFASRVRQLVVDADAAHAGHLRQIRV